jgi:hypothetical protein
MELAYQTSLGAAQPFLSTLSSDPAAFCPESRVLCVAHGPTIHFISEGEPHDAPLSVSSDVTALTTVSPSPWILCAGLASGDLLFFTRTDAPVAASPHATPVQRIHSCHYRETAFTQAGGFLLAEYGGGIIVTFPIDDILRFKSLQSRLEAGELKPVKWQLQHKEPIDSVLIFSKLTSPMFSGLHEFPAVFSAGARPFLSVCSIARPQPVGAAKKIFRALAGWFSQQRDEEPIPEAKAEWELQDEPRAAVEVAPSEDGRWLAVPDRQGRVSIIDAVFGTVTRILKGMRDAQVAWAGGALLIFAPARGVIVACKAPRGDIFHAVKVDRRGRLFQCAGEGGALRAVFTDGSPTFAEISVALPAG